jgi:thiamine monophosphate kinase
MFGAIIDLNKIPISTSTKVLLKKKKILLTDIFSNGDDYQVLFTSNIINRSKITNLSKKINTKISRIGKIIRSNNIIYMDNGKNIILKADKMGYTHSF